MLSVKRSGRGIPLLFLHAFPLDQSMWDANRAALSKNFELITVDLPGFGGSSPLAGEPTLAAMAQEIVKTIDGIGLKDKFVIAGLSMGGYVLLQLLQQIPDRFRAVAFVSTRSAADTDAARENRFKNIDLVQKEGLKALADKSVPALVGKTSLQKDPSIGARVHASIEAQKPEGVVNALRAMAARSDTTSVLSQINVPALVVAGAEDVIIPSAEMEAMAHKIPTAEFNLMPEAGHLLNIEQPRLFEELFLKFLKRRVL